MKKISSEEFMANGGSLLDFKGNTVNMEALQRYQKIKQLAKQMEENEADVVSVCAIKPSDEVPNAIVYIAMKGFSVINYPDTLGEILKLSDDLSIFECDDMVRMSVTVYGIWDQI